MKNAFEVRGDVTAIFLNYKGGVYETIIDTSDLPKVQEYPNTWFMAKRKSAHTAYVVGNIIKNNKSNYFGMHRYLMNPAKEMEVDHINGEGLDNRRSINLRNVTTSENQQNRRGAQIDNRTSGIRGVSFHKRSKKWRATIKINQKQRWLGQYATAEEAEKAVKNARKQLMPFSKEALAQ